MIVFYAGKTLFLSSRNYMLTINNGGGAIMVKRGDSENNHTDV